MLLGICGFKVVIVYCRVDVAFVTEKLHSFPVSRGERERGKGGGREKKERREGEREGGREGERERGKEKWEEGDKHVVL